MLNTAITMAHQGHSARVIGDVVGKSKDAVNNKLRRLAEQMRREAQTLATPEPDCGQEIAWRRKPTLMELEPWSCRWPHWQKISDEVTTFCGARRESGSSYCPEHRLASKSKAAPTGRKFAIRRRKAA